ncbi:MAG: hypothetical protein OXU33_06665, partial [Gemmatimonadota bacterium]|nr:hypothetical protein [Gemmatimonadota bacterium]
SRYDLPNPVVDQYFERSFEYVIGYLRDRDASPAAQLDPVGDLNLKLAKKVRRRALSDHTAEHPDVLEEMADAFFGLPEEPLVYWPQINDPEFASGISSETAAGRTLPPVRPTENAEEGR